MFFQDFVPSLSSGFKQCLKIAWVTSRCVHSVIPVTAKYQVLSPTENVSLDDGLHLLCILFKPPLFQCYTSWWCTEVHCLPSLSESPWQQQLQTYGTQILVHGLLTCRLLTPNWWPAQCRVSPGVLRSCQRWSRRERSICTELRHSVRSTCAPAMGRSVAIHGEVNLFFVHLSGKEFEGLVRLPCLCQKLKFLGIGQGLHIGKMQPKVEWMCYPGSSLRTILRRQVEYVNDILILLTYWTVLATGIDFNKATFKLTKNIWSDINNTIVVDFSQ